MLDLQDNQTVLDVACGTGANFKHILAGKQQINLYATDYSSGMLAKAQKQVDQNQWTNIHLFEADARTLNPGTIAQHTHDNTRFDRIICVLGLSVVPDWQLILDNLIELLKPDGKLVIVDVFAEKRTFNTWLVEKIAKADLDRPIAQALAEKTTAFQQVYMPIKESKVGGKLFVAVGTKA